MLWGWFTLLVSCRRAGYYSCLCGVLRLFKSYIYFLYVYIVYLFSCYLSLLLIFLVIFVLLDICFYINCDFLFCGKDIVIFVRFVFFILQVVLCSGVVLCIASYLLSSIADSVFFPIVIIASVILLIVLFWFLTIILFLLIICLISSYVILVLWPEIGPDHLGFQHCIEDHRPPENSWLQWILISESPYEGLHLKLTIPPKSLYYPELMPHTTQKARQKHKPNHPQMCCLKSDQACAYLQKTPLIWPCHERERSLSCGHKNIVARP